MNGLSDSLTVGLVLTLIFGALVFYLYTRIGQIEKRVSLTENILLDLKMATENTLMTMSAQSVPHTHVPEVEHVERMEEHFAPQPMDDEDLEEMAVENTSTKLADVPVPLETASVKMDANYEAMTLKELKDEAKRRGVKLGANPHKKDVIDALKRQGSVLEPVPGSNLDGTLEEGFPVELTK